MTATKKMKPYLINKNRNKEGILNYYICSVEVGVGYGIGTEWTGGMSGVCPGYGKHWHHEVKALDNVHIAVPRRLVSRESGNEVKCHDKT